MKVRPLEATQISQVFIC